MNSAAAFEIVFILFLFGNFVLKYYLDRRQVQSILSNRGAVPLAFAGKISLEAHQKAADYSVERIKFGQLTRITDLGSVLIATFGGLIQWIYGEVYGWFGADILAQIVIILGYALLSSLIDLPFSWYSTFRIEAKYGFNTTTPARFVKDLLLSGILSLILGIPILSAVLWIWNAAGAFWWFWAWLAYIFFILAVQWIYPTFIAPLFNKFTPLPEGELKSRLEGLLSRIGFASKGLSVMDASKRSAKGNAYMTGFGKNKRIVLFDTLLSKMTPEETEAVLAHELGHYKLHHIYKMMAFSFIFSLLFFWILSVLA